jgi:chorismate-pyruvate lyase
MAGFSSEVVWSRAYRLVIDELPVFAIREWFLRSVLEALDREARS